MGILGKLIEKVTDALYEVGEWVISGFHTLIGLITPFKKVPSEKIRAELRAQWLALGPEEAEIPGVEWEGEIYYETPK